MRRLTTSPCLALSQRVRQIRDLHRQPQREKS
jgi:hypothetical protein